MPNAAWIIIGVIIFQIIFGFGMWEAGSVYGGVSFENKTIKANHKEKKKLDKKYKKIDSLHFNDRKSSSRWMYDIIGN